MASEVVLYLSPPDVDLMFASTLTLYFMLIAHIRRFEVVVNDFCYNRSMAKYRCHMLYSGGDRGAR